MKLSVIMSIMFLAQSSYALTIHQIAGKYRVTVSETPISLIAEIQPQGESEIGELTIQQKDEKGLVTCSGLTQWVNSKKTILSSTVLCDSFEALTYEINFKSVKTFNNFDADVTITLLNDEQVTEKMNFIRLLGSDRR